MSNTEAKKPRKTRNILINPKFQFTVIGYFFVLTITLCGTLYVALRSFFSKYHDEGKGIQLAADHPYFTFLIDQQQYMNRVFLVVALVFLAFTLVFGLILSHRIAGPLYKLRKYFDEMSPDLDAGGLRFRKHDFFQEIPTSINQALERMKLGKK